MICKITAPNPIPKQGMVMSNGKAVKLKADAILSVMKKKRIPKTVLQRNTTTRGIC